MKHTRCLEEQYMIGVPKAGHTEQPLAVPSKNYHKGQMAYPNDIIDTPRVPRATVAD